MTHLVGILKGDGIGPEVVESAIRVIEATNSGIEWHEALVGLAAVEAHGVGLPEEALALVSSGLPILKGPLNSPLPGLDGSPNIALRNEAGLFVNVRFAKTFAGVSAGVPGMDVVIVREITEDIYNGVELWVGEDAAVGIKVTTRQASEDVARFAFEYARTHDRARVTIVHKASALPKTDGLFLKVSREVAQEYSDIRCEDGLVDSVAMRLVRDPTEFDVLLTTFQYGDILGDVCAALAGGLGLVPGASFGETSAFFEAAHGSAPSRAGKGQANPIAMILSGALLLEFVGEVDAARLVRRSTEEVLRMGVLPHDREGSVSTEEITEAIRSIVSRGR